MCRSVSALCSSCTITQVLYLCRNINGASWQMLKDLNYVIIHILLLNNVLNCCNNLSCKYSKFKSAPSSFGSSKIFFTSVFLVPDWFSDNSLVSQGAELPEDLTFAVKCNLTLDKNTDVHFCWVFYICNRVWCDLARRSSSVLAAPSVSAASFLKSPERS